MSLYKRHATSQELFRGNSSGSNVRNAIYAVILLLTVAPTSSNAANFIYTATKGRACANTKADEGMADWRCHGPAGFGAHFFDEGNTVSVSFGPFGREESLVDNDLMWRGADKVFGDKVEWRVEGGRPYAAILRIWRTDAEGERERTAEGLLVVKVTLHGSCKVGVVDAMLPNANAAARELADTAPSFRCGIDKPSSQ
jgi:hypothetical protein